MKKLMILIALTLSGCGLFKKTSKIEVKQGATIEYNSKDESKYKEESKVSQKEDFQKITKEEDSTEFDIVLSGNVKINSDGSIQADSAKIKGSKKGKKNSNENKKTEIFSSAKKESEKSKVDQLKEKYQESFKKKESDPDDSLIIKVIVVVTIIILLLGYLAYQRFKKP